MKSLSEVLNEVRAKISRYKDSQRINEQNTKASLIDPVIQALGWNISDIEEVNREFKPVTQDKPADYALLSNGTPRVLVEAKALGEEAADRRWASQVLGYAATCGAAWVLLTNGDEYRIYNAHVSVDVDDKLLGSVKVSLPETRPEELLSLLHRDRLSEDQLEVMWKTRFVDGRVQKVLSEMFTLAPEPALVRLIRKRDTKLSGGDVRGSLARVVAKFDFPADAAAKRATRTPEATSSAIRKAEHSDDVRLSDLIAAKILVPPLDLIRRYKGRDLSARVEADGSVSCEGKRYPSLSRAGGAARATVVGKRADGSDPATNGWGFWRFRDPNGKLTSIDDLRQLFAGRGGARSANDARGASATVPEGGGISEKNLAYQRFFQRVLDCLRDEHQFTTARTAMPQNWYSFTSGVRGFDYCASFANRGRVRAELRIFAGDEKRSKAVLEKLRVEAAKIEREFGEKLEWERLDGKKSCRIATYRPGTIQDSKSQVDEHLRWAIDRLLKFKKVFGERLRATAKP